MSMAFGGWLTLTLELWQNDIFLILIWINFTIYSYWKCPLCRIMKIITGAFYQFCLGRLNNVLHSQFGFGFALIFLYLPVIATHTYHISFSQCLTLNQAAGYNGSNVCIGFFFFFEACKLHREGLFAVMGMFVFSCY